MNGNILTYIYCTDRDPLIPYGSAFTGKPGPLIGAWIGPCAAVPTAPYQVGSIDNGNGEAR